MKIHAVLFVFATFILVWQISEARRPREQNLSKGPPEPWRLNPNLQRTTLNESSPTGKLDKDFARYAWKVFNRGVAQNEKRSKKKNKAMRDKLRMGISGFSGTRNSIGPQGPRGPPGPRGPKGANITEDEMMEKVYNFINEAAHLKLTSIFDPQCTELCYRSLNEKNKTAIVEDSLKMLQQNIFVPKIVSAFMWESMEYVTLPKQSRVELDMFKLSDKPGAYGRDSGDSRPDTGKFVVPRSGFYRFDARIHLDLPLRSSENHISTDDLISVSICIDSQCGDKMTLETITGLGPGERMTVTVGGMLHLKLHQYVSLFVENASGHPISIFDGSQFSGYITGV